MSRLLNGAKKLRILCLTTSFPSSRVDPAGFFVYQLTEALARQGAQITVLTPDRNIESEKWIKFCRVFRFSYAPRKWQRLAQLPGGIPVALKCNWKNYLLVPIFLGSFICNILFLARKNNLVLANWAFCGAVAAILSPFHQRPIVTVLRGSDVKIDKNGRLSGSFFLNQALKGSSIVVCVGKSLEGLMKSKYVAREKISCIPNGVHEAFFSIPLPSPTDTISFLFVGSLIPRKGADILLKAAAKLNHPKIRLLIAGEGPMEKELKKLARDLNIETKVSFMGNVPPGKPMAQMMSGVQCLVLPSHHEGRPNVVLEAMAGGRPVIGSDIESIKELVQQPETGYLFKDSDPGDLARAIMSLIEKPGDIEKMGAAARKWVLDQGFTWDRTANKYIEMFQQL